MSQDSRTDVRTTPGGGAGALQLVWVMTRGQRKVLVACIALSLVGAVLAVLQPRLLQTVVDDVLAGRPARAAILVLVGVTLGSVVLSGLQSFLMQRGAESVVLGVRRRIVRKFLSMSVASHDRTNSADLLSRAVADTNLIKLLIAAGVVPVLGSALTLVGITAFMIVLDATLFLVTAASVAVGFLLVVLVGASARESSLQVQRGTGAFSVAIERLLTGIRTVKAFNAERIEERNVGQASTELWSAGVRLARLQALVQPVMNLCVQGSLIAVIMLGAYRVSAGQLTLGELFAYIMYMFMLIMPISSLGQSYTQIQVGIAAATRIRELEEHEDESDLVVPADGRADAAAGAGGAGAVPVLAFDDVSFGYDEDAPALRHLSFEVHRGESVALVGRSGAGKSTVLELLMRFYEPEDGVVRIDGRDSATIAHEEYRRRFGFVAQDSAVLTGTLRENLTLGRSDATDDELRRVLDDVEMTDLLGKADFTLDTDLGQSGITLSGGQRQRLAWARVLLSGADVVVMDEPTSSLDAITERVMQRVLRRHAAGRTLLTVSHRPATIRSADRVLVLDAGEVVASGTHDELAATSPLYRSLVDATDDATGDAGTGATDTLAAEPAPVTVAERDVVGVA